MEISENAPVSQINEKAFGFDPWVWAILQIINCLYKMMNYSVIDSVPLLSLFIEA